MQLQWFSIDCVSSVALSHSFSILVTVEYACRCTSVYPSSWLAVASSFMVEKLIFWSVQALTSFSWIDELRDGERGWMDGVVDGWSGGGIMWWRWEEGWRGLGLKR